LIKCDIGGSEGLTGFFTQGTVKWPKSTFLDINTDEKAAKELCVTKIMWH